MDNTRAAYRILAVHGFYVDDELITVDKNGDPEEIYFDGIPNEDMEPLNELARERMTAYLEFLDQKGREAAEKAGRPFVGRSRTLDGQIELASAIQRYEMQIMGVKKDSNQMERVSAATDTVPDTGKRGRGRPSKASNISRVA